MPLHRTHVVPAIFATGPARAIAELANEESVKWVEWNSPIEFLMNQTVDTISARDVWDREVLGEDMTTSSEHQLIRGDGVTVVVLDSGIDATHPDLDYNPQSPANPSTPSPTDKVIYNAKLDQGSGSATPNFVWLPMQNTDTTSGHGTHCAGTVAGNGDASADDKLGVAPNSWLIGLSMGEAVFTIDEYSALEYVYDLSEPGSSTQAAWNIRVVTNSWGPGFPFDSADSNDLTVQIIDKLSWDNNVAVIFANGNDGGDGSDDRSNIFAKVPSAIGVAAANRNGVGMSSFSSRGDASDITTWPDIAAPGVDIWSAAARATMIGGGTGAGDIGSGDLDYYYLAISGTSMATPHVAGLVALMFQAAPTLQMSSVDEDLTEEGDPSLHDPTGSAPPATASRPIHEAELILKLTADRITTGENLATSVNDSGINSRTLDYAQGYGMVNAEKAVAVALALHQLRDTNGDGQTDNFAVTVWDAVNLTEGILYDNPVTRSGDQLTSNWDGEFAVFSSGSDFPPASAHRKEIWVPAGTTRVVADMNYQPLPTNILCPTGANLRLALDKDGDGMYEEDNINGVELTFQGGTEEGAWWGFDVQGNAAGTCLTPNPSTTGPRSPYDVELNIWLEPGEYTLTRNQSRDWAVTGLESSDVTFERSWFLHVGADSTVVEEKTGIEGMFSWMQENWFVPIMIGLMLLSLIVVLNEGTRNAVSEWRRNRRESRNDYEGEEVFEAEILPVVVPISATRTSADVNEKIDNIVVSSTPSTATVESSSTELPPAIDIEPIEETTAVPLEAEILEP
ncbi:MAG: S8 family serine peptidase, partial [Candidatus Poseidoniaceae archaeon]|nr:S8 family serine peptidase [Candidatus Poseidoniaceae archaeon]